MVGKNLKTIRERKAMTIRDLSNLSSVAPSTIVHIENCTSKAQPSTLKKLADALQVSVEELTKGI